MNDKLVKDKRIYPLKRGIHLLVVEYYRDKPSRDNDTPDQSTHDSLVKAQKAMAKFPRDDWDGYGLSERNYQEMDARRRD